MFRYGVVRVGTRDPHGPGGHPNSPTRGRLKFPHLIEPSRG